MLHNQKIYYRSKTGEIINNNVIIFKLFYSITSKHQDETQFLISQIVEVFILIEKL